MQKYIRNLYQVLFENNFSEVKENTTMLLAIFTICWSSLFLFFSKQTITPETLFDIKFHSSLLSFITGIFIVWIFSAIFFEFIAKIFNKSGRIRQLLVLSSFTFLPYIFVAPIEIMKKFSSTGYFLGTKIEVLLFLWVIILYAKTLRETYQIEKTSSYMLIFLPLISFFFGIIWLIGSISNLGYIYTV